MKDKEMADMNNEELWELKKRLADLPALKGRLDRLQGQINESEEEVKSLLAKYKSEAFDVERLQNESLSVFILRTIGSFDRKLDKETQEMLKAKAEYDRAVENLKQLKIKRDELNKKLAELNRGRVMFEKELQRREEELKRDLSSEKSIKYRELTNEEDLLSAQLVETQEAVRAANIVLDTIDEAVGQLDSAENWATYDIWFKGGILSHMAKYDKIDKAEEALNRLSSQIKVLRRELSDINLAENLSFAGVDSATRVIDFWFDNIFTDLNVRNRIRNDAEQLRRLRSQINSVISRLMQNKSGIGRRIEEIRQEKTNLIIK